MSGGGKKGKGKGAAAAGGGGGAEVRTDFSAALPDGGDVAYARDIVHPLFVLRLFEVVRD